MILARKISQNFIAPKIVLPPHAIPPDATSGFNIFDHPNGQPLWLVPYGAKVAIIGVSGNWYKCDIRWPRAKIINAWINSKILADDNAINRLEARERRLSYNDLLWSG